jgi:hypothetical protein
MKSCAYGLSLEELLSRKALPPIFGSDGDGDEETSETDSEDEDGGDDTENEDEQSDDEDTEDEDEAESNPVIIGLTEARDRYLKQRNTARAELKTAQGQIAKLEKDGTSDKEVVAKLSKAETDLAKATETTKELRLKVAFLSTNGPTWKDATAALRLVDMSDVEIDDDGSVHGMDSALKALAKKSPWLLATDEDPKPKPKKTGEKPAPKKGTETAAEKRAREAKLRNKFGIRR